MRKHYYLSRFIRSLLSVLIIVVVVFIMVFMLIPRDNIFFQDSSYSKLKGDTKYEYKMLIWSRIGYLDYYNMSSYCSEKYETGTDEKTACVLGEIEEDANDFVSYYESKGFTIDYLSEAGTPVAYKDKPIVQRIFNWFKSMIVVDHPWSVQDENNPDLERNISFGTTPTGGLAIKCSGCTHRYLLYTDSHFPFIHQNLISINMGESYPTYSGLDVLTVIFQSQGTAVDRTVTYETGKVGQSAIIFGSCKYKTNLDRLDTQKFVDNYADCSTQKDTPSMIGISFIMGILSLVLSYGLGLPIGLAMAKNKDGVVDKLGMVYIIFIISVPSLAYICLFRYFGTKYLGLPSSFPTFGASDIRSWVLPCISLALPSISSLMLWTRRYVVDQMNSDYVKFARAKGLNEGEIFRNHIFKNAIIPIAQGIPSSLAGCITGAIITEKFYAVGGMGKMLPDSITSYNNAMIIALTFMFSTISVLSVFMGDVVLTWVDPRIQLQEKDGR